MAASDPLEPLLHGNQLSSIDVDTSVADIDLAALSKGLGHAFTRAELAAEALTHRSALDRRPELKAAFPNGNERLEFLGDRVLSLSVADLLLRRFPNDREGDLARRFNSLVSASTLAEVAASIGLGAHLRLGDSEKSSDSVKPAILADGFEALLGAVFLDAGFAVAVKIVEALLESRLNQKAPREPKTALQEWAQARRLPLPAYKEVDREGPAHAPVFVIDVTVAGHEPARGRGASKREAEQLAAATLIERLEK